MNHDMMQNKNMNYEQEHGLLTMVSQEVLLSVNGGMGPHSCNAQVGFESGHAQNDKVSLTRFVIEES
uniref:Uncharacterized protein n=1 Tax=Solanum tuberosum TaxID=4113 RepID=M1DMW3_SOLTU